MSKSLSELAVEMLANVDQAQLSGEVTAVVVLLRAPPEGEILMEVDFSNPERLHIPKVLRMAAQCIAAKYGDEYPHQGRPS